MKFPTFIVEITGLALIKRQMLNVILVTSLCLLTGCAGVTVTPLQADGYTKVPKAEPGLRYYMPMPYLLVTELPPNTTTLGTGSPSGTDIVAPPPSSPWDTNVPDGAIPPSINSNSQAPAAPAHAAKAGAPAAGDGTSQQTNTGSSSQGSPSPISDTSFGGSTPQYVVKLIYLPDMSRPMAMTESTGLWGTSEMKPTLQDGWMLTSLDATADSQTAEVLQALGSIAGGAAGSSTGTSSAGKAAGKAATAVAGGPPKGGQPPDLSSYYTKNGGILRPGLYRFDFDPNGHLAGMTPVVFFTGNGTVKSVGETGQ